MTKKPSPLLVEEENEEERVARRVEERVARRVEERVVKRVEEEEKEDAK